MQYQRAPSGEPRGNDGPRNPMTGRETPEDTASPFSLSPATPTLSTCGTWRHGDPLYTHAIKPRCRVFYTRQAPQTSTQSRSIINTMLKMHGLLPKSVQSSAPLCPEPWWTIQMNARSRTIYSEAAFQPGGWRYLLLAPSKMTSLVWYWTSVIACWGGLCGTCGLDFSIVHSFSSLCWYPNLGHDDGLENASGHDLGLIMLPSLSSHLSFIHQPSNRRSLLDTWGVFHHDYSSYYLSIILSAAVVQSFIMRLSHSLAASIIACITPSVFAAPHSPQTVSKRCVNSASDRSCWGDYSLSTDYYSEVPGTG